MDAEQRDALRERNQRRVLTCSRCGSTSTRLADGSELAPDTHFRGMTYKVCSACGHEDVKRGRKGR